MVKPLYKTKEEKAIVSFKETKDFMFTKEQLSLFGYLEIPEIKTVFAPSEYKEKKIKIPKKKKIKKRVDHSWDFKGVDTKIYTHGFHNYPAMMIPQVAGRLLDMFSKRGDRVLDPFCGSGTVLVESKLRGLKSFGIDINPLAILLSKVKTTPIEPQKLEKELSNILRNFQKIKTISPPYFFNIEFWFKPEVIKELAKLKYCLDQIENPQIKDFFRVVFSETVRDVSNTRGGEFKLYRLPPEKLASFHPAPLKTFLKKASRNIKRMKDFFSRCDNRVEVILFQEDTRFKTSVPENSINLVVTSPPYGDSKTTVAYGQFSRLSLQWLGFSGQDLETDIKSLGGKNIVGLEYYRFSSPILMEILWKLSQKDKKRAREVLNFFLDLKQCFKEIDRTLAPKAHICIIIGNRTVKGLQIPTYEIIKEFGEEMSWEHLETIIREIPSKRIPLKSSPSNIPGETVSTMNRESIVIMQKD